MCKATFCEFIELSEKHPLNCFVLNLEWDLEEKNGSTD